ncbi:MAG: SusD/RagB family nutrient-binding outer membrane lipoprotein [Bacteroidota bacterium]|nr:SusD/RagB family nutrient-binding outer membrane lipoprotein [Bacteroidota bacterium]
MKRIIYYLLLIVTVVSTGCSDGFFDINKDPNNPSTADNSFLLPSTITGSAYVIGGYYEQLGGFWAQHYAQSTGASQWATLEEFSLDESDYDRQFTILYSGPLMDCQVVRDRAKASQDWSYYMVATLMQSYTFQVLADLYDQIPFSEALNGVNKMSPKYELGKDVNDSLIKRVDFALKQDLSLKTVSKIDKQDFIFKGHMDQWVRFGNTLKLKLYLRWVNVDPNKYKAEIQALLAEDNFLTTSAATVSTLFKNEENKRNPFYETFMDRLSGNICASKTLVSYLQNSGDSRLNAIFLPPKGKTQVVGLGQGRYKDDQTLYANIDNLSLPNVNGLSPVYFFTLPEVEFLLAEAELRYGTEAKAKQHYENGIEASYALYNVTPQPALYATGGVYEYNGLESIINQKWIAAANCNTIEAFFDRNRTGYPSFFVKSAVSSIGNNFPQRLLFPDTERKTNTKTPVRQNIDVKVWWAK